MRLLEDGEAADLWQIGQSEKYTDGPYHRPYVPQIETCVHRCARGLGAGTWGLENRSGVRTAAGCRETD